MVCKEAKDGKNCHDMKRTTFINVTIPGIFKWGKFFYLRLDASKYKNMLAVNLTTGVTECFDADNRVLSGKFGMMVGSLAKIDKGEIVLYKVNGHGDK